MLHIKSYNLYESVNFLINDIDKYKKMIKLIQKYLDINIDKSFNINNNSLAYSYIYTIIIDLDTLLHGYKIGDKKYSLSASGDDKVNELEIITKIKIGDGKTFTIDTDLFFEDIKKIDLMLYKVEIGEYHIKDINCYGSKVENKSHGLISKFNKILFNLESFYVKFSPFIYPKYTIEDIEDILLEFTDKKEMMIPYTHEYEKRGFNITYEYTIFELNSTESPEEDFISLRSHSNQYNLYYSIIFDSHGLKTGLINNIKSRLSSNFIIHNYNKMYSYDDNKKYRNLLIFTQK